MVTKKKYIFPLDYEVEKPMLGASRGCIITRSGNALNANDIYQIFAPSTDAYRRGRLWKPPVLVTVCEKSEIGQGVLDVWTQALTGPIINGLHIYAPLRGLHNVYDRDAAVAFVDRQRARIDRLWNVAHMLNDTYVQDQGIHGAVAQIHVHCNQGNHRSNFFLNLLYGLHRNFPSLRRTRAHTDAFISIADPTDDGYDRDSGSSFTRYQVTEEGAVDVISSEG